MPLCNESCNGEIEISAFGGIGPYTYSWLTGESSTTGRALNLCKGIHKVKVTDAIGCSAIFNLAIDAPAKLDIAVSSMKAALCSTVCDAAVSVIASGGTAPYTYRWDNVLQQTTQLATGLCSGGSYNVTVTDGNGCSASTFVSTTVNPLPTPSISGILTFCSGSSTTLDAGIYTGYLWSTGATSQTITVSTAATFTVTVTNANGCTSSCSQTSFYHSPRAVNSCGSGRYRFRKGRAGVRTIWWSTNSSLSWGRCVYFRCILLISYSPACE